MNPAIVAEVASHYSEALLELVDSSKPIINSLTMIAGERMEFANAIIDVIYRRVLNAPHPLRLPLLYLLDSILKNLRGNYVAPVCAAFVHLTPWVYSQSDLNMRHSIAKLVNTWPPYFGGEVVSRIIVELQRADGVLPVQQQQIPITAEPVATGRSSSSAQQAPVAEHLFSYVLARGVCHVRKRLVNEIVSSLYNMPHQCVQCGLRFLSEADFSKHHDYHFQQNEKRKHSNSRPWYFPKTEWQQLESEPAQDRIELELEQEQDNNKPVIVHKGTVADDTQRSCPVCGEDFVRKWDDASEEWLYTDTTSLAPSDFPSDILNRLLSTGLVVMEPLPWVHPEWWTKLGESLGQVPFKRPPILHVNCYVQQKASGTLQTLCDRVMKGVDGQAASDEEDIGHVVKRQRT